MKEHSVNHLKNNFTKRITQSLIVYPVGAVSQLRRINTPGDMIMIGKENSWHTIGIICPIETPDGGNIGIKKHLTITGHITFGCSTNLKTF